MAAYAALVSVMHIIEQIQNHPRPPIAINNDQLHSLTQNLTFLQDHLEFFSRLDCEEADALESRIAEAAYSAEDIIESHIVDIIQAPREITCSNELYQELQKVVQEMESITKEVPEIKQRIGIQLHTNNDSLPSVSLTTSPNTTMVGFDDILFEIMDKLTGHQSSRQIIPIVGMGGIGKTTLAKTVFSKPLVVERFHFRGWATISQEHNSKEILLEILLCLDTTFESRGSLSRMSEDKLGEKLYKSLSGRRYLIVMDDIWSIEAWDNVKFFFPDNNVGSVIMLTTRLSNLAFQLSGSCGFQVSFLDEDNSWRLFRKSVFGEVEEEDCPLELEGIGKKIAISCKGLPLSIAVIGGLLSRHKRSVVYWEYILENLNPILNLEDNERCLKILRLSYKELPVHLKPCFLYMSVFPEDREIDVSRLVKIWVAEGFLKPISGKSLEMVAKEYLKDLVDRNLILLHDLDYAGEIEYCKIHDLLRDLCLKEARKDMFLCFIRPHDLEFPHDIQSQRRIVFHQRINKVTDTFQSAKLRSVLCDIKEGSVVDLPFHNFRLLRVLMAGDIVLGYPKNYSPETNYQLANSRYLEVSPHQIPAILSSVYNFWNLQTIEVVHENQRWIDYHGTNLDIWKMPQLRHVNFDRLDLPDTPSMDNDDDFIVLGNLQTLSSMRNLKFSEEVVKRIPNVNRLKIYYERILKSSGASYCLNNICRLSNLESLFCSFHLIKERPTRRELTQRLVLPHSLKKLTLQCANLEWEEMGTKIGSLPHLQVLELDDDAFIGAEWETIEGQFQSLKYLRIHHCDSLEYWRTESTHFPCLEYLDLWNLENLEEIPLEIGEIPTLEYIELQGCSDSAVISAREILNEQQGYGNEGLEVVINGVMAMN